jgi:hypothetical protein
MSKTFRKGERRIRVHGVRKDPPDLRRLARALIELAQLQIEAETEGNDDRKPNGTRPSASGRPKNAGSSRPDNGDLD